ncbi:MAG: delta-60 repeat domain-containing protein [Actinomycetota bacterium]|nr:delta-60 repeat domain-containing protein [Actinomycetota bacterium]
MLWSLLAAVVFTASIASLFPAAAGAATTTPGTLDASFGTGGKAFDRFPLGAGHGGMAVLQDGSLVTVGTEAVSGGSRMRVTRFGADGAVLGSTGVTSPGISAPDAREVVRAPDDGVIVVGEGGGRALVAKLTSSLTLDTTFGAGTGRVVSSTLARGLAVAPRSDGKVLVAGRFGGDASIMRLNADGSTDTSFGTARRVVTPGDDLDHVHGVATEPDGSIVAVAYGALPAIWRLSPQGVLQGLSEVVVPGINAAHPDHLVLQPDRKILVVGLSQGSSVNLWVARLTPTAAPDPTFNANDFAVYPLNTTLQPATIDETGLALQRNGKVVVSLSSSANAFFVARRTSSGAPDTTFGTGGQVTTDMVAGAQETTVELGLQSTDRDRCRRPDPLLHGVGQRIRPRPLLR